MLYDVRLTLGYDYERPVSGGQHHLRVSPLTLPGIQRVIASSIEIKPGGASRAAFTDFFGNQVTTLNLRLPHDELIVRMSARVQVDRAADGFDMSLPLSRLPAELAATRDLSPLSPHHFRFASPRVPIEPDITAFARDAIAGAVTIEDAASRLNTAIHKSFAYDTEATTVDTALSDAFALKRGVCQDFSHVMIAGLRGLGIPAGYVSGFLRTVPPKGKPRLEGADAMHAWVMVWGGRESGWREFDPTNNIHARNDHIVVGFGRDYADIAPVVGVLKTFGSHEASQSVDVIALDAPRPGSARS